MSATSQEAHSAVPVDDLLNEDPTPVSQAKEQPAPDSPTTEFDPIVPELKKGGTIILGKHDFHLPNKTEPGVECKVKVVRTRQLLQMGRVLTGATRPINLNAMIAPIMTAQTEDEQYAAMVAAFTNLLITVPHSEAEFIALLGGLVEPLDDSLISNNNLLREFFGYMNNPDLEDAIAIFVQMFMNEKERWQELGKVLMNMFPQRRNTADNE